MYEQVSFLFITPSSRTHKLELWKRKTTFHLLFASFQLEDVFHLKAHQRSVQYLGRLFGKYIFFRFESISHLARQPALYWWFIRRVTNWLRTILFCFESQQRPFSQASHWGCLTITHTHTCFFNACSVMFTCGHALLFCTIWTIPCGLWHNSKCIQALATDLYFSSSFPVKRRSRQEILNLYS